VVLALFLHWIFVCKLFLNAVVSSIIFLILSENFGVIRKVLLVGSPFFVEGIGFVCVVLHCKVRRANVVMVDPVLNVFHVVMRHWETQFTKLVNHFFLGVLSSVPDSIIKAVQLLTEILLSLLTVDLAQLLHLKFVLSQQMFLFLSKVAEVFRWASDEDLPRWNSLPLGKLGSS